MIRLIKHDTVIGNTWEAETILEVNLTDLKMMALFMWAAICTWMVILWALITWPKYLVVLFWQWRNSLPESRPIMWVDVVEQSKGYDL
jgi:hypothetical protein